MVKKNKDLPDSAAHPQSVLSLSLSLADAVHPEGTPGSCWGWALAELMLSNYVAGEDFWESLGQQGD